MLERLEKMHIDGLYVAQIVTSKASVATTAVADHQVLRPPCNTTGVKLWHNRMGHALLEVIKNIIGIQNYGKSSNEVTDNNYCSICVKSNQTKAPVAGLLLQNSQHISFETEVCSLVQIETLEERDIFLL